MFNGKRPMSKITIGTHLNQKTEQKVKRGIKIKNKRIRTLSS